MQNTRRVARELALKVLFQVDVGKQPLAEALDGTTGQIRMALDSSVNQVTQEAQRALRQMVTDRGAALAGQISANALRQIKSIATSMTTDIRGLAGRASEIACELCNRPSEERVEGAITQFGEAADAIRAGIHRLAARDSACPNVLRDLQNIAVGRSVLMEEVFVKHVPAIVSTASFMLNLVHGATENHAEIDERLAALSSGWALERQAAVDRNIMRLAAYEILYVPDIPAGASINEAVELAKKYSTAESGRFVNGVLGALQGAVEPQPVSGG